MGSDPEQVVRALRKVVVAGVCSTMDRRDDPGVVEKEFEVQALVRQRTDLPGNQQIELAFGQPTSSSSTYPVVRRNTIRG